MPRVLSRSVFSMTKNSRHVVVSAFIALQIFLDFPEKWGFEGGGGKIWKISKLNRAFKPMRDGLIGD